MTTRAHSARVLGRGEITRWLEKMREGDPEAGGELLSQVYHELLALDGALGRLAQTDARAAELVNLCFFVGLTQQQAARELGVSVSTVERKWAYARAWLFREIRKEQPAPE